MATPAFNLLLQTYYIIVERDTGLPINLNEFNEWYIPEHPVDMTYLFSEKEAEACIEAWQKKDQWIIKKLTFQVNKL